MKRNYIPFIAGMSTMLLLVGLVGASLAGETRPPAVPQSGTLNGQVAYGEAGVALFGKEQVPAGAAWTTEDGAQIPTVLTYTDENGEDHYFISAETAAEVLDMVYGAVYREDLNCIDFGTEAAVDAEGNPRLDGNGQPIYWTGAEFFSRRTTQNEDGTERIVAIGDQKAEIQVGDGTSVIVGHGLEEDSPSGRNSSSGRWRHPPCRSMASAAGCSPRWTRRCWIQPPIWGGSWTAWPSRGRI